MIFTADLKQMRNIKFILIRFLCNRIFFGAKSSMSKWSSVILLLYVETRSFLTCLVFNSSQTSSEKVHLLIFQHSTLRFQFFCQLLSKSIDHHQWPPRSPPPRSQHVDHHHHYPPHTGSTQKVIQLYKHRITFNDFYNNKTKLKYVLYPPPPPTPTHP